MTTEHFSHIPLTQIVVDPTFAKDRVTCTQEIIRRIRENDFPSYEFSFDETGYPNMLVVSVYENGNKAKRKDPIFENIPMEKKKRNQRTFHNILISLMAGILFKQIRPISLYEFRINFV